MNIQRYAMILVLVFISRMGVAADPLQTAIEQYKKARGQAIARENQIFERSLNSALKQAQQQKNQAEIIRIEPLLMQLREETAKLLAKGDTQALLPTNDNQLRTYLAGTKWSVDTKSADPHEFTPAGEFKNKKTTLKYVTTTSRRVTIIWSPSSKIDCEFNDDYSMFKELGGLEHVWTRVR